MNTLIDGPDPRLVGAAVVLVFVLVHAGRGQLGFVGQNGLVAAKVAFLVVFVVLGLALGSNAMPTWAPPSSDDHFPMRELIMNQFWIAFAFSGWNAAAYVAKEFRNPTRDVGRAMIIGMGSVAVLYLLINWIFVANLTPAEAQAVFTYEQSRISLAHLVAQQLFGAAGGAGSPVRHPRPGLGDQCDDDGRTARLRGHGRRRLRRASSPHLPAPRGSPPSCCRARWC